MIILGDRFVKFRCEKIVYYCVLSWVTVVEDFVIKSETRICTDQQN